MNKVHNLLRALIIDCGTWDSVFHFCQQVAVVVTDHGVESLLTLAPVCILLTDDFMPSVGAGGLGLWNLSLGMLHLWAGH